jgi:hypothetical protein
MSGGAVIIIIDPKNPQQAADSIEPTARVPVASPYTEAMRALEQAELDGATVRIIGL